MHAGDRRCLASTSHDETLRLWDLAILHDEGSDGEEPAAAAAAEQVWGVPQLQPCLSRVCVRMGLCHATEDIHPRPAA